MKFSIIIPTWKHLDDLLKPCIESIQKFTDFSETECIIVANGCGGDGTREYVESLGPDFRLVWIEEQSGYTKSMNMGIRAARGSFLIPFNNDCILLDQPVHSWIETMYAPFSDPKVGITGPVTNYCHAAQREFLLFLCVMIRRETLNQLGGQLDETFSPGGGEDTAFCIEAQYAGWKMVDVGGPTQLVNRGDPSLPEFQQNIWVNSYPIYHAAGMSFGSPEMFDGYQKVIARNGAELQRRYSVNISRAQTIEGWMADSELMWLAQQARKASVFIEVGSWCGRSSRAIADNLPADAILACADTFNGSSGEPDAHITAKEREGDGVYMKFTQNLYDHIRLGRVMPLRMESANAAEVLRNMGVQADVIFLDGDHSEAGFRRDVEIWQPLLKEGGLFCGHDYYLPEQNPFAWIGVRTVVSEMFPDATQAPNTTIWQVRKKDVREEFHAMLDRQNVPWVGSYPVSQSVEGYGGFFARRS